MLGFGLAVCQGNREGDTAFSMAGRRCHHRWHCMLDTSVLATASVSARVGDTRLNQQINVAVEDDTTGLSMPQSTRARMATAGIVAWSLVQSTAVLGNALLLLISNLAKKSPDVTDEFVPYLLTNCPVVVVVPKIALVSPLSRPKTSCVPVSSLKN